MLGRDGQIPPRLSRDAGDESKRNASDGSPSATSSCTRRATTRTTKVMHVDGVVVGHLREKSSVEVEPEAHDTA